MALGALARPVRGSWTVVLLRTVLAVLATAPAWSMAVAGVGEGPAKRPYYTDVEGPLPMVHLMRMIKDLPESWGPVLVGCVGLFVIVSAILTAGALAVLAPGRRSDGRGIVGRLTEVWSTGWAFLPAFLRILLLELVFAGVGLFALERLFGALDRHGQRALWSGYALSVLLPLWHVLLAALFLSKVGAWGLHTKAGVVLHGERRVRREALATLRRWWDHKLSGPVLFMATSLVVIVASGGVLVTWRQAPPVSATGAWMRMGVWFGVLLLISWAWHFLVRVAAQHAVEDA